MIEITSIEKVYEHISGLKVILFDLDDTLYGEKEYVRSGYRKVAKLFPACVNMEEELWAAFEKKQPAFDYVLRKFGVYSETAKTRCIEVYRNQTPDIHLYDGVERMLVHLKKLGYKLGIITDGRVEGQNAKIKALCLHKYFDKIIVTDALGGVSYRKPCDRAFVIMKEYFNVEYNDICYVGDNIVKDFIAPEKLGMKSIWFKNKDGLYYQSIANKK